jgi:hypothetical protein
MSIPLKRILLVDDSPRDTEQAVDCMERRGAGRMTLGPRGEDEEVTLDAGAERKK